MIRRLSRQMPWFRNSSYSPSESSVCDHYTTQLANDELTPRTYGLFRHHTAPEGKSEVLCSIAKKIMHFNILTDLDHFIALH